MFEHVWLDNDNSSYLIFEKKAERILYIYRDYNREIETSPECVRVCVYYWNIVTPQPEHDDIVSNIETTSL